MNRRPLASLALALPLALALAGCGSARRAPEPRPGKADSPPPVVTAPAVAPAEAEDSSVAKPSGGAPASGTAAKSTERREAVAPSARRSAGATARDEAGGPSALAAPVPAPPPSRPPALASVEAPALKAGRHDDNKEYNAFLAFLAENRALIPRPVDVGERLVVRALDREGKSLANCGVSVDRAGKTLSETVTYADGRTQFFPSADAAPGDTDFAVTARCAGETRRSQLPRAGRREVEVRFQAARTLPKSVPVDIAVVIDTTGSMQSQIDRLKKTLQAIHFQLTQLPGKPDIRFGLVAYRDRGDEYVTQVTGFTADVRAFQSKLDRLEADGGGDTPEDMQAALEQALHALAWRPEALRLGFVISDATLHTDYGDEKLDYAGAMRESLKRGIKWVMVGAGGLGRDGEVVYRQIAQFTMAEYVFVTDSGAGDHEGGAGEASHHVGANYRTENLDQAIVRIVRRELSYLTDSPRDFDDTIVAQSSDPTPSRDTVLGPAVDEALRQLADYSSLRLAEHTPVAVVPVTTDSPKHKDVAGYLTDRFVLAASRSPAFRLVERDLTALAQEQKLQLSDLFDVTETVPIGKLVGADVLIVSKLTVTDGEAALFAKLLRVETGEVLSVSRVVIGKGLVPGS
jgi:Mg-chelatase subunit ChlD